MLDVVCGDVVEYCEIGDVVDCFVGFEEFVGFVDYDCDFEFVVEFFG